MGPSPPSTRKSIVGGGGLTFTTTLSGLLEPPGPVHCIVYVWLEVSGPVEKPGGFD